MKPAVREMLEKAKEVIADPHHWTQRAMARGPVSASYEHARDRMHPLDTRADCWCSLGAIAKVANTHDFATGSTPAQAVLVLARVISNMPYPNASMDRVVDWNDHYARKHSEVLAVFDKAIQMARTEET